MCKSSLHSKTTGIIEAIIRYSQIDIYSILVVIIEKRNFKRSPKLGKKTLWLFTQSEGLRNPNAKALGMKMILLFSVNVFPWCTIFQLG